MEPILEAQDYNVPILELSKEDIINKNNLLLKLCLHLQAELEDKYQEIHNCKKELTRLNALEVEYINDIEVLQSEAQNECKKIKLKIQNLEEEISNLNDLHTERLEELEQIVFKRDEKICKLQDDIQLISNVSNFESNKSDIEDLQLKNTEFENLIQEVNNEIIILRERTEFLEKQHLVDIEQNNNLLEELRKLNESYEYKKEELNEIKQLNQTLEEDLILIKQELDAVKSKSCQNVEQANSLFAEVDEKRLVIQEQMALMKSQYLEMKSEHGNLLCQIANLNSTNVMLCQRWETELQDKVNDDDTVEEAYKARIKLLESQIEICARVLSDQENLVKDSHTGEIKFLETLLDAKNKEIKRALVEGDSLFLFQTMLSQQLRNSNMEMRSWKTKVTKYESDIPKLQAHLENSKLKQNIDTEVMPNSLINNVTSLKDKQSVVTDSTHTNLKSVDVINMADSAKRIDDFCSNNVKFMNTKNSVCDQSKEKQVEEKKILPKRVEFTEDAIEHSDTSRSKLRRGTKIILCKPLLFKKKT